VLLWISPAIVRTASHMNIFFPEQSIIHPNHKSKPAYPQAGLSILADKPQTQNPVEAISYEQ